MAGSSENVSMSGMEEASRESSPRLNETARLTTGQEISETLQVMKQEYEVAEQVLLPDPSPLQGDDEEGEELATVCVENDYPPSRPKLETRKPLMSFEDAMKLPYNQDCLKPLFGPGMSQRAWDSGKFNIELHCTDPWMKKNWRRCRNMCKGGREGGVKFNQLRRNFMRMLWFERKGIHIDWETVDVSSRLVSEQRGTRELMIPGSSEAADSRKLLREERRRRRRAPSPLASAQATDSKRTFDVHQGTVSVAVVVDEDEENKRNFLGGIRALQEAGLTVLKLDDLTSMRSDGYRDRDEIVRLKSELEKEYGLRIAVETNRQDELTKMHIDGCRDREEIVRLKTEVEIERAQRITAEAHRTEVLQSQLCELQQRRDRLTAAPVSCSLCQEDLTVLPTVNLGFCKCQYHVHCFWKHFATNGMCMCRKSFPDLLYKYFGRLPLVGTRNGQNEAHQGQQQRAENDGVPEDNNRINADIDRAKRVVRELLREWHDAGGRNGWHLLNLSETVRISFDAFHADLQKRAQTMAGSKAREILLSYANKFGLNTGNFKILYPGLDIPEELLDMHCVAGGSNFSDESGTQVKGEVAYASEDGEEGYEYRRKMEMVMRATSDIEAKSEIEDNTAGVPKRRRK